MIKVALHLQQGPDPLFSDQLGVTQESTGLLLLIIKTIILRVFMLYINKELNRRFFVKILCCVMDAF